MNSCVYLETTIVSYLTARPSRDLVLAAHQEVTREWWTNRGAFDLCNRSQVRKYLGFFGALANFAVRRPSVRS